MVTPRKGSHLRAENIGWWTSIHAGKVEQEVVPSQHTANACFATCGIGTKKDPLAMTVVISNTRQSIEIASACQSYLSVSEAEIRVTAAPCRGCPLWARCRNPRPTVDRVNWTTGQRTVGSTRNQPSGVIGSQNPNGS